MNGVECYELFGGIALKNHAFSFHFSFHFMWHRIPNFASADLTKFAANTTTTKTSGDLFNQ